MKTKCNKCDERGMIIDTPSPSYSAHSCPCGESHRLMEEKFKNVSIEDLLNYGRARAEEKGRLSNNE